jgi:UDP-N-acetylglucosamine 1-carboxyvinyltransferase
VSGGKVTLQGIDRGHLKRGLHDELKVWESVGISVTDGPEGVIATAPEDGSLGVMPDLHVRPDGIYSDSHPLLAVLATRCEGGTTITDQVWTRRYGYADGLRALDGRVLVDNESAHIGHSPRLRPSPDALHATDLRCAAAYLLAALRVRGTTVITGARYLRRGYSDLISKLRGIGVDIDAL